MFFITIHTSVFKRIFLEVNQFVVKISEDGILTVPAGEEPKTRQKLNLQPRTKPVEEMSAPAAETAELNPAAPTPTAPSSASIFGKAKPVDTAAREREIEERLAKKRDDRPAE